MFSTECTGKAECWRVVALWLLAAFLLRTLLAAATPLFPDETYYWEWSRRLAAGYFDHPPAIAWMIAAGAALPIEPDWGVRLPPLAVAFVTQLLIVMLAAGIAGAPGRPSHSATPVSARVSGESAARAAARAAILSTLLPLATLGLVLATPDAPLLGASVAAIFAVDRALTHPGRSRASMSWWVFAGVFTGIAFLSKYTAVLLPCGMFIAFLLHPGLRRRLAEPGPWLAVLIAACLFLPVVIWNESNDFVSFRFQLGHGLGTGAKGNVLTRELELIGGQLGLATPVLAVLMAITVWRSLRQPSTEVDPELAPRKFLLAVLAATPIIFFAVTATRKSVEANWPALAYPPAIALLAAADVKRCFGRWWNGAVWTAALVLVVLSAQVLYPVLPVAPRKDPVARAYGWDQLAAVVDSAAAVTGREHTGTVHFASERYQDASELAFHLKGQPVVLSLNIASRPNQYDLWPSLNEVLRPGDNLVAAFDDNPAGDERAELTGKRFRNTSEAARVALKRGVGEVAHRKVWVFTDALPMNAPSTDMLSLPARPEPEGSAHTR